MLSQEEINLLRKSGFFLYLKKKNIQMVHTIVSGALLVLKNREEKEPELEHLFRLMLETNDAKQMRMLGISVYLYVKNGVK